MVNWIFCECGKAVDEFESRCHWCGRPASWVEDTKEIRSEDSLKESEKV